MYVSGNIIYFTPYYFADGGEPKSKYLIILMVGSDDTFIAGLATRSDHVPSFISKSHGCINDFKFPLETFLYGSQLVLL